MKKFLIIAMMCLFVMGVTACEAKDKTNVPPPEQKQEVKKEDAKPVEQKTDVPKEQAKTSPLPSKKAPAPAPEPKKSLVVFESSTDGIFIVKIYADNKEVLTDALSYDQLNAQLPKTLELLYKKKEGK